MKKGIVFLTLIFCLCLVCCGCNNQAAVDDNDGKPIIAVSIPPEAAFVKAIGGDIFEVVTMVPAGNSPSNYEPTPALKEQFSQACIYFSIGVPTEANNILPYVSPDTKVVSLNDGIMNEYPELLLDGKRDPHIWLSPKRVIAMCEIINSELAQIDPENADVYQANTEAYIQQLQQLDADIREVLADIKNRKFIVFHPAFGYLADDYGLQMYALEEGGKEATAAHLQEMIDLAKDENIKIIFYQAEIDSHQSQSFAEEIGGKTIMLDPLSEDYIENMKSMAQLMAEVME